MAVFSNNYLKQSNKPNYEADQFLWPVNVWQVYTSLAALLESDIVFSTSH